ncbi:helix-hairpin-helix domain-containing protein [Capsulimonas corticalis]|nr:helix-hairpin-helix domain-containing protein [Capsulimonas corticalis]
MTNRDMAAMLFNIATLLRDREDNPYRIRAYERGARALLRGRANAAAILGGPNDKARIAHRKWELGERLQLKLRELATTGELQYFHELCEDLPPYMEALMELPGVGPRTAQHLHEALGAETADDVVHAARTGKLKSLWGFGEKRTSRIAQLSLFDDDAFATNAPPARRAA